MINYSNVKYDALIGSHSCDCGSVHDFSVRCVLAKGAFDCFGDFLATVTPRLSRIALLYDDERLMERVLGGVKKEFRPTAFRVDDDKKDADALVLPEDVKLIVAIGSSMAINCAKYKAYLCDLPLVVASLPDADTLTSLCVINDDGLYSTYITKRPVGYIFDLDYKLTDAQKAALFGQIAARLNASFEYYASYVLFGGEFCPFLAGALSDVAAQTVLFLSQMDKAEPAVKDMLLEQALKLALLCSQNGFGYGERQCALTYSMLNDCAFSQGELQFVFSAVLSSLYKNHVLRRPSFTPPPDNLFRLEQIAGLFGVDERRALPILMPQLSGREAAIIEYKIKEYTAELLEKLDKNVNLYRLAFRAFKRLYNDDGYSLLGLVGSDISLSLALAPDFVRGGGFLTALKRLGELDCYIV